MKKTRMTVISLLLFLVCGVYAAAHAEEMMLVGTDSGEEVFKSLASAFEKLHPGVSVSVPENIEQIGSGVHNADKVARQTAADAEAFTAATQSLSRQAEMLKRYVEEPAGMVKKK